MTHLEFSLKIMTRQNRDGSFSTQKNRQKMLMLFARQIRKCGFPREMVATSLTGRHINSLLSIWENSGITTATIKNRMAVLRWWANKIGRPHIISKGNSAYGISRRIYITNVNKAQKLDYQILDTINNCLIQFSIELQALFGLRKEESIKFIVSFADRGDHLILKPSWCKGSRGRQIPIRNKIQRDLLDRIHLFVGSGSLIPDSKNYKYQMKLYERLTHNAGLRQLHGLRHNYAQQRYFDLFNQLPPILNEKKNYKLTPDEKKRDRDVRLIISEELGHSREQITATYLGR